MKLCKLCFFEGITISMDFVHLPDVEKDTTYNIKYLKEDDKKFLEGFDHAFNDSLGMILSNLDPVDFDIEGEDINLARLLINHSKVMERLEYMLKRGYKIERSQQVVDIIDAYDGEEYKKIKDSIDATTEGKEE